MTRARTGYGACATRHTQRKGFETPPEGGGSRGTMRTRGRAGKAAAMASNEDDIKKEVGEPMSEEKPPKEPHGAPVEAPDDFLCLFDESAREIPTLNNSAWEDVFDQQAGHAMEYFPSGPQNTPDTRKFKIPTQHTGASTSRGTPRTQATKRRGRPPNTRFQPPAIVSPSAPYHAPRGKPRSSRFNGVCRHAKSGRYEAHVWLRESRRQVYLGGHVEEEFAAEAFDIIVLKLARIGDRSRTGSRPLKMNFPESRYADLIGFIDSLTLDELIMEVRRHSEGFARGASGYRGVTRHSESKYEARLGVPRSTHMYLGLYDSPEKAAIAYDTALVQARGRRASTNFPLHNYNDHIREYEMNTGRDGRSS